MIKNTCMIAYLEFHYFFGLIRVFVTMFKCVCLRSKWQENSLFYIE